MNWAVEMVPGGMIHLPNFTKTCLGTQVISRILPQRSYSAGITDERD
jgi:hypothetical protein